MLLKARFTMNVEKLNAIVDQYNQTNGVVKFLTQPVFTSNSEVVGEQNEIMFFIGFVAGLGVHDLEHVAKA